MKHNIESSLKRFLKRKVKITMGFVVAFLITGTVGFAESITGEQTFDKNVTIESSKEVDGRLTGIYVDKDNKEANIIGKTITIHTKDKGKDISGISVVQGDKDNRLKLDISANLDIDSISTDKNRAFGIFLQRYTDTNINGDIKIKAVIDANNEGGPHSLYHAGLVSKAFATFKGENFDLYSSSLNGLTYENGTLGIQISSDKNTAEEITKTTFNYKNMNVISEGYGKGTVEGIQVRTNGKVIFNNDNTNIMAKSNRWSQGLVVLKNGNVNFEKGDVHIVAELVNTPDGMPKPDDFYAAKGLYILGDNNANVTFGEKVGIVTIEAHGVGNSTIDQTLGVQLCDGTLEIKSKEFNIIVDDGKRERGKNNFPVAGIYVDDYANDKDNTNFYTSEQTKTNINVVSALESYGLQSSSSENIIFNGDTSINVTSKEENAIGVDVTNTKNVVEFNKNLLITAKGKKESIALNSADNGKININKNNDSKNRIQITGDINAETDGTITANLSTKDSFITGVINDNATGDKGTIKIGMDNGATWNNAGDSSITELTLNNGIINNTSVENDISVGTLKGTGGDINMVAEIGADGIATSGKLAIDKVDNKDAKFNVNYSGEGNLEVSQEEAKKVFEDLAENITVGEGNSFNANAKLEEGLISREYEAEFVKGSGDDVVVKPETVKVGNLNSMVEGMRDLATINVLSWRQEMSSLNERMGELRDSTGSNGVWARVYGGKVENGSKYDNEYQTYQVGYDKKYPVENGDLFVGALVSYTDGKTDYNLGDGENYSVGAGVYATWLNRDGQFADVVLKQSRLHNKFDVRSKNGNLSQHGDYSNWGTSLSGQYGRRFDLDDKFFVEPSVQLTFGRVSSEDYTTSAGVKVEQDTAYTLVGDVGTAVGYKFSDKGNVYARASLVKEFKGDIDTKYSYGGATEHTSEDLSDTWGEFGVGVNYRIKENVNMYVDIQRTEEATVENKWQANLGFRWEF